MITGLYGTWLATFVRNLKVMPTQVPSYSVCLKVPHFDSELVF